jgi:hypothetical protein
MQLDERLTVHFSGIADKEHRESQRNSVCANGRVPGPRVVHDEIRVAAVDQRLDERAKIADGLAAAEKGKAELDAAHKRVDQELRRPATTASSASPTPKSVPGGRRGNQGQRPG